MSPDLAALFPRAGWANKRRPERLRIHWIHDGLSANRTPDIREAHFRPINEFVVSNADYLDWDTYALASTSTTATGPTATGASRPSNANPRSPPER